LYFKPSDAKKLVKEDSDKKVKVKPTYKNGAKQLVFKDDAQTVKSISGDTTILLAEASDSIAEEGYYINGFMIQCVSILI
jgi:hypothetical protein